MNVLITKSESATMTSREIAELTGKRHDNVMADIRKMLVEIGAPEFSGTYKTAQGNEYQQLKEDAQGCAQNFVHPQNGQTYREYALDRGVITSRPVVGKEGKL